MKNLKKFETWSDDYEVDQDDIDSIKDIVNKVSDEKNLDVTSEIYKGGTLDI